MARYSLYDACRRCVMLERQCAVRRPSHRIEASGGLAVTGEDAEGGRRSSRGDPATQPREAEVPERVTSRLSTGICAPHVFAVVSQPSTNHGRTALASTVSADVRARIEPTCCALSGDVALASPFDTSSDVKSSGGVVRCEHRGAHWRAGRPGVHRASSNSRRDDSLANHAAMRRSQS